MGLLFSFMLFGHLYHSVFFLFPAHHHMKARPLSDRHKPDPCSFPDATGSAPPDPSHCCTWCLLTISVTDFASFLSVLLGLERGSHPDPGPRVMILCLQRVSVPVINFLPWEHILSQPLGHPAELFFLLDCTNGDFSLKLVSDRLIRWRAPCPLLLIYQCTELFYLCITASLFNDSLTWTSVMHGSLSFWPVRQFACNIAISMEDFKNKVKPYLFTRINQQILFSFNSVFLWILLLHTLQRQTWGLWVRSQDAATADVSELYYGEGHTTKSEGGENRTEK